MSLNKRVERPFSSPTAIRLIFTVWLIVNLFIFLMPISFGKSMFKNSDNVYHIFFSFLTALFFYFSFKNLKIALPGSFLFPVFYGFFIETLQNFLPYREFSTLDLLCNATGGAIFIFSFFLWKRQNLS